MQDTVQIVGQLQSKQLPANYHNICLDVIVYNRTFTRNRGTLSQIVKSLQDMKERLSEPSNQYQKGLYPHIQKECDTTVQKYNEMVQNVQPSDYCIFGFYLNGPRNDGKRKPTNTSHEMKSYGVSEFKETVKSMNDRLRHIKTDCAKKIQEINQLDSNHSDNNTNITSVKNDNIDGTYNTSNVREGFTRMINFCDQYHHFLVDRLNEWDGFIVEFRKSNGVTKETKMNAMIQKQHVRPVIKSVKPIKMVKYNLFLPRNQNFQNTLSA